MLHAPPDNRDILWSCTRCPNIGSMRSKHHIDATLKDCKVVLVVHGGMVCNTGHVHKGCMGDVVGEERKVLPICGPVQRVVADHPKLIGQELATTPSSPDDHCGGCVDECLEIGWSHRREVSVVEETRFIHSAYLRAEIVQVLSCTDRRLEALVVTLSKMIS